VRIRPITLNPQSSLQNLHEASPESQESLQQRPKDAEDAAAIDAAEEEDDPAEGDIQAGPDGIAKVRVRDRVKFSNSIVGSIVRVVTVTLPQP
jgi:hypothetical protein